MKIEQPQVNPSEVIRAARHNLKLIGLPELTPEEELSIRDQPLEQQANFHHAPELRHPTPLKDFLNKFKHHAHCTHLRHPRKLDHHSRSRRLA